MHYLGIEIGGTKLQLGLGPGDGTLAGLWRDTVDVAAGPEGIRRQITAAVPALLAKTGLSSRDLKGIGIGFGGPVDDVTRTVIKSHQIEGWDNFPLADWVSGLVGLPAVLGNDADCAGLAEALFGAGKGLSPIFYITIGSGIGGGLILDGEIYRGCGRGAAEIGHLEVGNTYIARRKLESVASGWGIAEMAREDLRISIECESTQNADNDATILLSIIHGKVEAITSEIVARAAARGDILSRNVLDHAWQNLTNCILHVITLVSPRRIIIGGGVSQMGEQLLFDPIRRRVAERVFEPFRNCYEIVPAALGEEVVVHGALALARKRLSV